MRLTTLDPRWVDLDGRRGLGFLFRCATGHCREYNVVLFANPLDKGPPCPDDTWALLARLQAAGLVAVGYELHRGCGAFRWTRKEGTTWDTLTLDPSVDVHECGHFWLKGGEVTLC